VIPISTYCKHLLWFPDPELGGEYECEIRHNTSAERCIDRTELCSGYERGVR